MLGRAGRFALWILENFGSLGVFYACLRAWGLVAAIVSGLITGAVFVAYGIWRDGKVSPFNLFCAANVAIFGFLDLRYQTGFFVKLEPAFGNVAMGLFFLGSVVVGRPIIIEFAERASGRKMTRVYRYFRGWTIAWSGYFFLRAAAFVWLAYHVALEQALVARAILGPISYAVMFAIEIPIRFAIYGKRAFGKGAGVDAASPTEPTEPAPPISADAGA